jgi:tetratricopeptide (TPR) repeat protein/CHAT domain-containing protein
MANLKAIFMKGKALYDAGKYAESVPFTVQAVELAPKVFGPDHLNTADILNSLGGTYNKLRQYKEAAGAYRRCLEIREMRLPKDHEKIADALNNLAFVIHHQGQVKEATAIYERSLAIREATLPADHPDIALALNNLGGVYEEMGLYFKALNVFERSLRIQETKGKEHPGVAYVASNLANVYVHLGRLEEAEAAARRALKIREKAFGPDHLEVAASLPVLAVVCDHLGRGKEAETLLRRCLAIRESRLGKDHPSVASVLSNLGGQLMFQGRYGESEAAYRRCLEIKEAAFGKEHTEVATAQANLALLYSKLGRRAEAEQFLVRSLKIRETKQSPDHPDVAATLSNLAGLYTDMGRFQDAEAMYRRCLEIDETRFGKDHIGIASVLNSLGILYRKTNRPEESEKCFLRTLRLYELQPEETRWRMVYPLNNLAMLYWQTGRHDQARVALKRCLDILEPRREQNHTEFGLALFNLAGISQALNQKEQASELFKRYLQIVHKNVANVFAFSSEAAMHSYLQTLTGILPNVISMAVEADSPGPANQAALTWTLRFKGIAFETQCRYGQVQHDLNPDDPLTQRLAKYQSLKKTLANAALKPSAALSQVEIGKQLAQWRKQAEELESELNRGLSAKQPATNGAEITAAAVQKRLGSSATLVEFIRSPLRQFKKTGWSENHYFAFVLSAGQAPAQLIDLGPAKAIDAGVEALRKEFTDFQEKLKECESVDEVLTLEKTQEKQFAQVSTSLYQRLFAPLRKALGPAQLLYLAPDSALNRLPFEALVDDNGKYLVETYRCAYLSSGRDLLRTPVPPAKGTVVFAGPDYKFGANDRLALAEKLLAKNDVVALRGMPGNDLRSIGWKALPGAATEAQDIQKTLQGTLYGPVKTYVGPEALEEVLKAMPAPRILHLATHGFFLDYEPASHMAEDQDSLDEGAGAGWARGRLKKMDNPLLRSGIVMAGANTIGDKEATAKVEDGWVTAEEIALLNLRGTDLVVLSACQTGLGEVKSGEGVFGLRRAFLYAGARTLVTSLFEVPDKDTRDLMQHFYSGLKAGQGKLSALHTAQNRLLQSRRRTGGAAHPFYWASFVMVGDPD